MTVTVDESVAAVVGAAVYLAVSYGVVGPRVSRRLYLEWYKGDGVEYAVAGVVWLLSPLLPPAFLLHRLLIHPLGYLIFGNPPAVGSRWRVSWSTHDTVVTSVKGSQVYYTRDESKGDCPRVEFLKNYKAV